MRIVWGIRWVHKLGCGETCVGEKPVGEKFAGEKIVGEKSAGRRIEICFALPLSSRGVRPCFIFIVYSLICCVFSGIVQASVLHPKDSVFVACPSLSWNSLVMSCEVSLTWHGFRAFGCSFASTILTLSKEGCQVLWCF